MTTEGFRDLLEIQFQIRPRLYDIFTEKPAPLVPRDLCFEVVERIGPHGQILRALDERQVIKIARELSRKGVQSVAVCFLHSYVNDVHEKKVKELLASECPTLPVTLSSELCPTFREYPRASTTCINACILPIVGRYVWSITKGLKDRDVNCQWYLIQSNGGILKADIAAREPCRIIESGPAAGVIVAAYVAEQVGHQNALCLDMGGTTAKIGMILNRRPMISSEFEVGAAAFSRSTARRASGYPLRTPSIDLVEIGAGGGSIAWVDSGGILRVGPRSAGADPGPSCYPNGGAEPTITDANLVLGRLNAEYFLGGEMKLDLNRAEQAIRKRYSEALEFGLLETASAIVDVAVSNMVNAIRFISVERGYDPREFSLVTTGGAGPLHSNFIADELNIPRVIVQPSPGVASALGLILSDIRQEVSRTVVNIESLDWEMVRRIIADLVDEVRLLLKNQDVPDHQMEFLPSAEMRYAGQSYELSVPISFEDIDTMSWASLQEGFNEEHKRAYGFSVRNEETVVVNLRVTGVGRIP